MNDEDFFRTEIDGKKVWLPYSEIHAIRKDVLLFFDDNVGEPNNVLFAFKTYNLDYWKYISIDYDDKWAESESYTTLIEEGCLAILHGITLEILDENVNPRIKNWYSRNIHADTIIPYVENYKPKSDKLITAKTILSKNLSFIQNMSANDINEYGELKNYDLYTSAKWFDEQIVQKYFSRMYKIHCLK